MPLTVPSGYSSSELAFRDLFPGLTLNSRWHKYITSRAAGGFPWNDDGMGGSGGGGGGNNAEYYKPSQVSVNNGLTLTAIRQSVVAPDGTYPFTSGVVCSYGNFEFKGGYLQVEMKASSGKGSWPGIWLLPGSLASHGDDFEIDVQEGGFLPNPARSFAWHLHGPITSGGVHDTFDNLASGFHVYAVDWVPGESIKWFFDGVLVAHITIADGPIPDEYMEVILSHQVASGLTSGWHEPYDVTSDNMAYVIAGVELYQHSGAAYGLFGGTDTPSPPPTPPSTSISHAHWYFAFVDETETTYDPGTHARVDAEILGFTFEQKEGDFATLRLITRNPLSTGTALGLLGPGRKRWAWFSWDKGDGPEPLMLGRLVGIPTDVFGAKVTLDFQARPANFVVQKAGIAAALRVLPYWDPAFIDEQRRLDPDLVLETRSAVWYVDPTTLELDISDVLIGEDGTDVFLQTQHIGSGLQMNLGSPPLTSVTVDATVQWTQRAAGGVDMTQYFATHWGNPIESYTFSANDWPKTGTAFGDGWTVTFSKALEPTDFNVRSVATGSDITIKWWDGDNTSLKVQDNNDVVNGTGLTLPTILTNYTNESSYSEGILTSWNVQVEWADGIVPLHKITQTTIVSYDAARPMTEHITFTLTADVQPVVTLPGDDQTLRLDNLGTSDLSEPISGVAPIGDPRRRSYIVQDRGQQSLRYLILLARSHLRMRARAIELTFSPFLDRLSSIKLNRNATLHDWRLPGGVATGKIIGFTCTLKPPTDSGGAGLTFQVTIGCAVGHGGSVSDAPGAFDYVDDLYIAQSQGYQEYTTQVLTFNDDVGFTVPLFSPNDDGMDFTSVFTADDIIAVPLVVENPASVQADAINSVIALWGGLTSIPFGPDPTDPFTTPQEARQNALNDRNESLNNELATVPTRATFKLKDMKGQFTTERPITVTQLKIPTMIDLSAT